MRRLPSALSIAGLDPSGGAGLAADLRAFAAAGVWGTAVCAALTVQSTRGVRAVKPVPSRLVLDQAREVLADARILAIKTGALGTRTTATAVAHLLEEHEDALGVVDPVMIPSRGVRGVRLDGGADRNTLLRLGRTAVLCTPNLPEAQFLLGGSAPSPNGRELVLRLRDLGLRAVLVKGGHRRGAEVTDWFAAQGNAIPLCRPRRQIPPVHGTGCLLSALIAGRLAAVVDRRRSAGSGGNVALSGRRSGLSPKPISDAELLGAVRWAILRLDRALEDPLTIGGGLSLIHPNLPNRIGRRGEHPAIPRRPGRRV